MPDSRALISMPIASGASVSSSAASIAPGYVPAVIFMSAAWDAAAITFQISQDGTNWYDLYDAGTEISATVAAGRAQALTASAFNAQPGPYWRLRSGTGASPVTQNADRALKVLFRKVA